MRVELHYTPGCRSYKQALNLLEAAIAEERLPCSVELKEVELMASPLITVDGEAYVKHSSISAGFEELCNLLSRRWHKMMTEQLAFGA